MYPSPQATILCLTSKVPLHPHSLLRCQVVLRYCVPVRVIIFLFYYILTQLDQSGSYLHVLILSLSSDSL